MGLPELAMHDRSTLRISSLNILIGDRVLAIADVAFHWGFAVTSKRRKSMQ